MVNKLVMYHVFLVSSFILTGIKGCFEDSKWTLGGAILNHLEWRSRCSPVASNQLLESDLGQPKIQAQQNDAKTTTTMSCLPEILDSKRLWPLTLSEFPQDPEITERDSWRFLEVSSDMAFSLPGSHQSTAVSRSMKYKIASRKLLQHTFQELSQEICIVHIIIHIIIHTSTKIAFRERHIGTGCYSPACWQTSSKCSTRDCSSYTWAKPSNTLPRCIPQRLRHTRSGKTRQNMTQQGRCPSLQRYNVWSVQIHPHSLPAVSLNPMLLIVNTSYGYFRLIRARTGRFDLRYDLGYDSGVWFGVWFAGMIRRYGSRRRKPSCQHWPGIEPWA